MLHYLPRCTSIAFFLSALLLFLRNSFEKNFCPSRYHWCILAYPITVKLPYTERHPHLTDAFSVSHVSRFTFAIESLRSWLIGLSDGLAAVLNQHCAHSKVCRLYRAGGEWTWRRVDLCLHQTVEKCAYIRILPIRRAEVVALTFQSVNHINNIWRVCLIISNVEDS